jgi:hypothetical protein
MFDVRIHSSDVRCSHSIFEHRWETLPEEIAVTAGSLKVKVVAVHSVNEDPIRFYVTVTGACPFATQRVIMMSLVHRFA